MKQILATLALIALALSFASCDKTCNCNCPYCCGIDSDQTIQRPGNNNDNNNNNDGGGGTEDNGNTGGNGNTGDNGGSTDETDRSNYEVYNHTMTQGYAEYYGAYYEDQPTNTANWYLALGESNYDFEAEEPEGYAIIIELFTSSSHTTSIPSGTYTVEAFDNEPYSPFSLLYGFTDEDNYALGTWLCEGVDPIAGATAGWVKISASGSSYTITYELYDDEYGITFKGSYSGALEFYDGTETASYTSASKNFAPCKSARTSKGGNAVKHYRIRK